MKTVKGYRDEPINAYQSADITDEVREVLNKAGDLWHDEWMRLGSRDHGTCCLDKGIQVPYIGKGKRDYAMTTIVPCNFVQGNLAAQESVPAVLAYLEQHGIKGVYNDGRMD